MKNRVINALIDMNLAANLKGFDYITEIIMKYDEDESYRFNKLTMLYHAIGKKKSVSGETVERDIRKAFKLIFEKGDPEVIKKYLTFQNRKNGNLLSVLYLRLKQEEENENRQNEEIQR